MSVTTTTDSFSVITASAAIDEQIYVYDSLKLNENMSNIKKILMSDVSVMLDEVKGAQRSYSVKGRVYANITYQGENDRAENLSGVIPFEFSSEGLSENDEYLLDAKIVNCEAVPVRQRRVDLNVSVGLKGLCLKKEQRDFITSLAGKSNIQTKKMRSEAKYIVSKNVTVPLSFELSGAELEQAKVLCASVNMREYSTNSNYAGILLSASLCASAVIEGFSGDEAFGVRCLEETKTAATTFEVPSELAYEEYFVSVNCVMDSAELSEQEGKVLLTVSASVCFNVKFVSRREWESVCDAYSIDAGLITDFEEQSLHSLKKVITQRLPFRQSMPLSPGSAFYRLGAMLSSISYGGSKGGDAAVAGRLNADAFVVESVGGEYEIVNISVPFSFDSEESTKDCSVAFSCAELESMNFYCEGASFVAEGVIKSEILLFEEKSFTAIVDCTEEESDAADEECMKITVVYYDEDNDLWETAKKNRTSVGSILEANLFERQEDIPLGTPLVVKSRQG